MWWYWLVVWGVWEIVIFCFCLLGVWEIVIFCLQSSGRMFANRPFFGPFFTPSSPKGDQRVLDVHRPCRETPADPPIFPPPPLQKGGLRVLDVHRPCTEAR